MIPKLLLTPVTQIGVVVKNTTKMETGTGMPSSASRIPSDQDQLGSLTLGGFTPTSDLPKAPNWTFKESGSTCKKKTLPSWGAGLGQT